MQKKVTLEERAAAYKHPIRAFIRQMKNQHTDCENIEFKLRCEEGALTGWVRNENDILNEMWACDYETLHVRNRATGQEWHLVLIYFNTPYDFISDYSVALEPYMKDCLAACDKYQDWAA